VAHHASLEHFFASEQSVFLSQEAFFDVLSQAAFFMSQEAFLALHFFSTTAFFAPQPLFAGQFAPAVNAVTPAPKAKQTPNPNIHFFIFASPKGNQ
jgi:hypothetical protein